MEYCCEKKTLWIKWIHAMKLKGRSIWEIDIDSGNSWGWKNLLKVRNITREKIKYKIANGDSISMWHDNWSSMGPLMQYITHRDIYNARLTMDITYD